MKNNNDKSKWEIEAFKRGLPRKSRNLNTTKRSNYSQCRNDKGRQLNHVQSLDLENVDLGFAQKERMCNGWHSIGNFNLEGFLKKFLTSNLGQDWDTVFSKFMKKLPNDLKPYQTKDGNTIESIYRYIAVNAEFRDDVVIERRSIRLTSIHKGKTRFEKINLSENGIWVDCKTNKAIRKGDFYVCPETKKVCQIPFEEKPKKEKKQTPIKPSVQKAKADAKKAEQAQEMRELLTASNRAKKDAKKEAKEEAKNRK